jgi:hypothetical protein
MRVEKDANTVGEIESILVQLNDAVDEDYLPPRLEECENQTGSTYNSCPYAEVCFGCQQPSDIALFQGQ